MGQISSLNQLQYSQLLKQYEQTRTIHYGIQLKHLITRDTYLLKEISYTNKDQYNQAIQYYQLNKYIYKQHILNLIQVKGIATTNFCQVIYKIYLIYEFPTITLHHQINARAKQQCFIQQKDLWTIIESCLDALSGDSYPLILDPKIIFVQSDGNVKIINKNIILNEHKYSILEKNYYAPERIEKFAQIQNQSIKQKQIIFSLGMTILHAGLLENCYSCYDWREEKIKQTILDQKIQRFSKIYSSDLTMIIRSMLQLDPNNRASIGQLEKLVRITKRWKQNKIKTQGIDQQTRIIQGSQKNLLTISKCHNQETLTKFEKQQTSYKVLKAESMKKKQQQIKNKQHFPVKFNYTSRVVSSSSPFIYENPLNYNFQSHNNLAQQSIIESNQSNLFTHPKLLEMIKNEISEINSRKISLNNNQLIKMNQKSIQWQPISKIEQNGSRYYGKLINNKKQGKGKLVNINASYYEGQFQNDQKSGFGIQYYPSGQIAYKGQWKQNLFNGMGKLINNFPNPMFGSYNYKNFNQVDPFWCYYEGQFKQGKKHGKGKLYLTNGEHFEGQFLNDNINGMGKFYDQFNKVYEGNWQSNVLIF